MYISGLCQWQPHAAPAAPALAPRRHLRDGGETARRLWEAAGVGPGDVDLPQLYDGFSPFVYFWLEVLGFCPVGEAHRFVQDGGIDSDLPRACPCSQAVAPSVTVACTACPRCSSATSNSRGAPETASASGLSIGLACHASPHLGGAVVYSATAF